jgi:predicted transposase/invertase (TIGR01784 family)
VFKALLTHPDAKPVLRDVISSVLRIRVVDVTVLNVELPISGIAEKRERFDVNCVTDDGRQIDVEMQTKPMEGDAAATGHANLKDRAIYYLCDLHTSQTGRGIPYGELMRSYQIMFCGFALFPEREKFVSRYGFRDEDGAELSDAVGIVFVELSKLGSVVKKPVGEMTGVEMWSVFFGLASDPEHRGLLNEMIAAKEEIKMASELLTSISKDEIERAHYRSRKMYLMDMEHAEAVRRNEFNEIIKRMEEAIKESRKEGMEKGREEEREEGRKREARNMLRRNRPIDEIAEDTGLTRAEIDALRV